MAEKGWEVLFLGTGALGQADNVHFPPHENISVRLLPFVAGGWRQKWHYLKFSLWVIFWTLRWRPAWIYASDLLSCPAAWILSLRPGAQTLYHEHDTPGPGQNLFQKICHAARRKLACRARLCILPNQQRLERFITETGRAGETLCVWNCPRLEEVSPARRLPSDEIWILYHGNIGPELLPVTVLEALAMLPENMKLRVVGYETLGHLSYVRQLKDIARQLGIFSRVDFVDAVPRHKLLEIGRKCDIGLAVMPMNSQNLNMRAMVGASNKVFDYLACGLPLIVSDLPDWRGLFAVSGYGLTANPRQPESLAEAMRWYCENPAEMRAMGEHGRQRVAAEWNYERQFAPVLAQMLRVEG